MEGMSSWVWVVAPLAVAAFGVILLLAGVGNVFRGRPATGVQGVLGGGLLSALGLAASLLGLNLQTYSRLTYERPVAEVRVAAVNPAEKRYLITIRRLDGSERTQTCALQGDEWQVSGRVQKWRPWANVLGLNLTYDLEQASNKYISAAEANGKPITACDLADQGPLVNKYVPKGFVSLLLSIAQAEDRRFGSAVYMPLADGAAYNVIATQMAFNAEPANAIAELANNQRDNPASTGAPY